MNAAAVVLALSGGDVFKGIGYAITAAGAIGISTIIQAFIGRRKIDADTQAVYTDSAMKLFSQESGYLKAELTELRVLLAEEREECRREIKRLHHEVLRLGGNA